MGNALRCHLFVICGHMVLCERKSCLGKLVFRQWNCRESNPVAQWHPKFEQYVIFIVQTYSKRWSLPHAERILMNRARESHARKNVRYENVYLTLGAWCTVTQRIICMVHNESFCIVLMLNSRGTKPSAYEPHTVMYFSLRYIMRPSLLSTYCLK